jgi:hypothetical protein
VQAIEAAVGRKSEDDQGDTPQRYWRGYADRRSAALLVPRPGHHRSGTLNVANDESLFIQNVGS